MARFRYIVSISPPQCPDMRKISYILLCLVFAWLLARSLDRLLPSALALQVSSPTDEDYSVSTLFMLGDSSANGGNDDHSSTCVDLLEEKMGLRIIPPFCTQNGTVEGLLNGLNFGSSLATIINTGDLGFQSLNHQLGQVFDEMLLRAGYTNLLQHDTSGARRKYSDRAFTDIELKQMIWVVENLYNASANKIVCLGIRPLGCSPRALWESYNSTATPTRARNLTYCAELVLQVNAMLSTGRLELNDQFYQGMPDCGFCSLMGEMRIGGVVDMVLWLESGCVLDELACNDPSQRFC